MLTIRHPDLQRLYAIWTAERTDGRLPPRAAFSLHRVMDFVEHVAVMHVTAPPYRLVTRVAGEALVRTAGEALRDRFLDEVLTGPDREQVLAALQCSAVQGTPEFLPGVLAFHGPDHRLHDWLVLPCADNGMVPNKLVVGVYPSI